MMDRKRGPTAADRRAPLAGLLAGVLMASAVGCEVDCNERYCDFVRAGAAGIFAWEYDCCLNPDSAACEDRGLRYERIALNAPLMRMACQDGNWERLRELWDEIRGLVPVMPLRIIVRDFCGFDVLAGENVSTPFGPADSMIVDLGLEWDSPLAEPSALAGRPTVGVAPTRAPDPIVCRITEGSTVGIARATGRGSARSMSFSAHGHLELVSSVAPVDGSGTGDDLDPWCRRMDVMAFQLDLQGSYGDLRLDLDPDFVGNALWFTAEDAGVLGVAVEVSGELDPRWGGVGWWQVAPAWLELPVSRGADGRWRIGDGRALDALDVWPVAGPLKDYLRSGGLGLADGMDDCGELAREIADHFVALHVGACGPVEAR